jgi:hypothetical protein
LAEENRMSLIISMAKSLLDFNRVDSLEEIFAKDKRRYRRRIAGY